jgi:hypothetical protein
METIASFVDNSHVFCFLYRENVAVSIEFSDFVLSHIYFVKLKVQNQLKNRVT